MALNSVEISGEIIAVQELRYTPAGIPRVVLKLRHLSQQSEANILRRVSCEIEIHAFAKQAEQIALLQVGQQVRVKGFLAQQSLRNRQLVLHINDIFLE